MALYPYLPPTARENRVLLTPFVMLAEAAASNPQVYLLVFRYLQQALQRFFSYLRRSFLKVFTVVENYPKRSDFHKILLSI